MFSIEQGLHINVANSKNIQFLLRPNIGFFSLLMLLHKFVDNWLQSMMIILQIAVSAHPIFSIVNFDSWKKGSSKNVDSKIISIAPH